jgi:hypothetical protein
VQHGGVDRQGVAIRGANSLAFPIEFWFCMALFYGRTGRLTTLFGVFRPGQARRLGMAWCGHSCSRSAWWTRWQFGAVILTAHSPTPDLPMAKQ